MIELDQNLIDIPIMQFIRLTNSLNKESDWKLVVKNLSETIPEIVNQVFVEHNDNPAEELLIYLSTIGFTVERLLKVLDKEMIQFPQLLLRRKFIPVRIAKHEELIKLKKKLILKVVAGGFPYPKFLWEKDGVELKGVSKSAFSVPPCVRHVPGEYVCTAFNEIPSDSQFDRYRLHGKQHSSSVRFGHIIIQPDDIPKVPGYKCPTCVDPVPLSPTNEIETPSAGTATDKVALVICNSNFEHRPSLNKARNDAGDMANGLIQLGFKIVTLCDLTLKEMELVVQEYKELLGEGVYAVFYYVGHGCDASGQSYLLPVDVRDGEYSSTDCLCAQDVLYQMQDTNPALNVLLLDTCRQICSDKFIKGAPVFEPTRARNTVYGFATGRGSEAFEKPNEENGMFMKHLKNHLTLPISVMEMLNRVIEDVANDEIAKDQRPEVSSNLSRKLSLADEICWRGCTTVYEQRTLRWQSIHELPPPILVKFANMNVRIYFDYDGPFSNVICTYSFVENQSVEEVGDGAQAEDDVNPKPGYQAYIRVPSGLKGDVRAVRLPDGRTCIRTVIVGLQKLKNALYGIIEIWDTETTKQVDVKIVKLADFALISILGMGTMEASDFIS